MVSLEGFLKDLVNLFFGTSKEAIFPKIVQNCLPISSSKGLYTSLSKGLAASPSNSSITKKGAPNDCEEPSNNISFGTGTPVPWNNE